MILYNKLWEQAFEEVGKYLRDYILEHVTTCDKTIVFQFDNNESLEWEFDIFITIFKSNKNFVAISIIIKF